MNRRRASGATHPRSSLAPAGTDSREEGHAMVNPHPPASRSRRLLVVAPLVVALLAALALLIWWFDWNWFKHPLENAVRSATGREFVIAGDLDVDLGLTSAVRVHDVRLGNPPGWATADMATAEALELHIALLPLWHKQVVVPLIHAKRLKLRIERDADGRGNWEFGDDQPPAENALAPEIGQLDIVDSEVRVLEPKFKTDLRLAVHSGEAENSGALKPLLATGDGSYRGFAFTLAAKIDSPLSLQRTEAPYRLDISARAGDTRARIDGALRSPLQLRDFDLQLALSGADLADLYPLAGVALPATPPYRTEGRIGRTGATWHYRQLTGKVGDSDIAGDVSIAFAGKRPFFKARLEAQRLDLDDLAGFIGAPPQTGPGEAASAAQKQEAQRLAAAARVLPDKPYNLTKLRAMDADVELTATRINAPDLPIESLATQLKLADGLLRLEPFKLGIAGGQIDGYLQLDARADVIAVTSDVHAQGLTLAKLVPGADLMDDAVGAMAGKAQLRMQGNSVADMLAAANGEVGVAIGKGQVSNLLIELAGLDIAEALRYALGKDRQIELRCAYADFGVASGLMTSRAFAIDTSDTFLRAAGTINLRDEQLDLKVIARPKDRSPFSVRSPLVVGGTFKDPSFLPQAGPLLLRGAAAAALFAVVPPAALLALIETGPGQDVDCGAPAADAAAD